MRARLLAVSGLILTLGLACGGFSEDFQQGFEQGKNEALAKSFSDVHDELLKLPHSPPRKRMLELIERGQADAEAGKLDLVDASVFVGEVEAAIGDGELTMEEVGELETRYASMASG